MFITLKKAYLGHNAGATLDIAEDAVGKTLIEQGIADEVKGDPYAPIIAKAMESSMSLLNKGLDQAVTTALKQFADAQSKSNKNGVPAIFGEGHGGDPKKTFGDFALAVARNDRNYLEKHYGSQFNEWQKKAALGDSSGATGGYTVPPDFYAKLVSIMEENTFFRQRAFVQPMASATLQIPYLDITTVETAGVSPFFGGVQMSWTAEAQTRTETEPAFKQLELKANELSGYSVSSNILLQDAAFGLEKFLFQLFGRAIAWFEEYAYLQGNGVGKPLGILNAGATVKVTRAGGANTSTIALADIAKMFGTMLPSSQTKCCWATNPSCIQQLIQLADAGTAPGGTITNNGTGTVTVRPASGQTGFTYTLTSTGSGAKAISFNGYSGGGASPVNRGWYDQANMTVTFSSAGSQSQGTAVGGLNEADGQKGGYVVKGPSVAGLQIRGTKV